jgi:hypothetical protein
MVVGFPTLITGRPSQELVDRGKELEGNLRLKLVGTVGTTSQAEIDQYKKLGRDVLGLIGNINAALSFEIVPLLLELGEDPELLRRTMVFNATVYQRRNLDRPTETLSFFGDLAQTATNVAERLHVIYGTDPAWDPVFEPTQFPWTISFPKLPTLGHRKGSLWRTAQHWCRRHKRRPSGRESVDASIEGES